MFAIVNKPAFLVVSFIIAILLAEGVHGYSYRLWGNGGPKDQVAIPKTKKSEADSWKTSAIVDGTAESLQEWREAHDESLSENEKRLVATGAALFREYGQGQGRKGDCFREAAEQVKTDCSGRGMGEVEKVRYAIELTRCEVMTAGQTLPKRCDAPSKERVTGCVEAISSVGQLWTSYSGYFRDVTLMCASVRFDIEKDALKHLYRNITHALITQHEFTQRRGNDLPLWMNWAKEFSDTQHRVAELAAGVQRALQNELKVLKSEIVIMRRWLEEQGGMQEKVSREFEGFVAVVREKIEGVGMTVENALITNLQKNEEAMSVASVQFVKNMNKSQSFNSITALADATLHTLGSTKSLTTEFIQLLKNNTEATFAAHSQALTYASISHLNVLSKSVESQIVVTEAMLLGLAVNVSKAVEAVSETAWNAAGEVRGLVGAIREGRELVRFAIEPIARFIKSFKSTSFPFQTYSDHHSPKIGKIGSLAVRCHGLSQFLG
ncbi:hypothetical protein HDU67_005116 [Dinochytrium kinnereticum]|nr:hypothetical protein HDU67_005116 [Dinochytrium kinnereticum]